MAEISREELKGHCIAHITQCERWAEYRKVNLDTDKHYQEHKMVLDMVEKLEKIEKIVDYVNNNKEKLFDDELAENLFEIVHIVKG